jgi:hypothetical protein
MESGAWPVWPNGAPRWPLAEAAAAAPAETTAAGDNRPLDDVMLAMDVVDTLRHSRRLVEKELASEENDAQLLRRLRKIYASQGIEVPDEILREGVAALKEQRFVYKPPPSGFWTFLARLYVTRKRWRADLFAYALIIGFVWFSDFRDIQTSVKSLIGWQATESTKAVEATRPVETTRPVEATRPVETTKPVEATKPVETTRPIEVEKSLDARQVLLDEITTVLQRIYALGPEDAVMTRARTIYERGKGMAEAGELARARAAHDELVNLYDLLALRFEMRIVSRPNVPSGVWRVPDANPNARNYYLIVEAIDGSGNRLPVEVTSEEDGLTREVTRWGVRVSEETFERVKADKLDDGIIQNVTLAVKRVGRLQPDYLLPVLGGVITEW